MNEDINCFYCNRCGCTEIKDLTPAGSFVKCMGCGKTGTIIQVCGFDQEKYDNLHLADKRKP